MQNNKSTKSSSRRGATILEVLVGVAILGIVIGTATSYLAKVSQGIAIDNAKNTQMRLFERIQVTLTDPDAIINSMSQTAFAGNQKLKNCVGPGVNCPVTNPSPYTAATIKATGGFVLYPPGPIADSIAEGPVASGEPGRPAYFNTDGAKCNLGEPKCHWQSEVFFFATCPLVGGPPGTPSTACSDPMYLNFRFRVRPAPGVTATMTDNTDKLYSYPADKDWDGANDPSNFTVRMRTADVLLRIKSECTDAFGIKTNVKQTGISRKGEAFCSCLLPKTSSCGAGNSLVNGECRQNGTLKPVCGGNQECKQYTGPPFGPTYIDPFTGSVVQPKCNTPNSNPPYQCIMGGYDQNGKLVCIDQNVCSANPPPPQCPCVLVDLTTTGDCGTAGAGFWLVSIDYGECAAITNKSGKGGQEKVTCTRHNGRCCKLDFQ